MNTDKHAQAVIIVTENFADSKVICDELRSGKTVIINTQLGNDDYRRMVDYLTGATYALSGRLEKVNASVLLVTPKGVDVESKQASDED
jgi:cell division inhibitor SepF